MKMLTDVPNIDETVRVVDRALGGRTDIMALVTVREAGFGSFSCMVGKVNVVQSKIGKLCSFAEGALINPCNHAS